MKPFAKIFETTKGQVLIIIQDGDEGLELVAMAQPEGLGVCQARAIIKDDPKSRRFARKRFDAMTEKEALMMVEPLFTCFQARAAR
jgi:hypothetical protein